MVLVLCGKAGAGKDTIAKAILEKYGETVEFVPSTTSRPMRPGEKEGVEYHFVSKEQFEELSRNGAVLESRTVETENGPVYYGTQAFETCQDKILLYIKDLDGAKKLRDFCEEVGEGFECVMLTAEEKVRKERSLARSAYSNADWEKREERDNEIFSFENMVSVVTKFIPTDSIFTIDQIAAVCYYAGMHGKEKTEVQEEDEDEEYDCLFDEMEEER